MKRSNPRRWTLMHVRGEELTATPARLHRIAFPYSELVDPYVTLTVGDTGSHASRTVWPQACHARAIDGRTPAGACRSQRGDRLMATEATPPYVDHAFPAIHIFRVDGCRLDSWYADDSSVALVAYQRRLSSRILLLVLSPEPQNLVTSLLFLDLFTGSE